MPSVTKDAIAVSSSCFKFTSRVPAQCPRSARLFQKAWTWFSPFAFCIWILVSRLLDKWLIASPHCREHVHAHGDRKDRDLDGFEQNPQGQLPGSLSRSRMAPDPQNGRF